MPFQHYKNRQPPKQHTQDYYDHLNYRQTDVAKQWNTNLPTPMQMHYIALEQPNSWLYNHQTLTTKIRTAYRKQSNQRLMNSILERIAHTDPQDSKRLMERTHICSHMHMCRKPLAPLLLARMM